MLTATEGHRQLEAALLNQSTLAARIGCTPQAISRILRGGRPGPLLAAKLREVLGIDEASWRTEDERIQVAALK